MAKSDSPGVVAPPLLIYMGGLMAGWVVHRILPLNFFSGVRVNIAGSALILFGAGLVYWSFDAMRQIGTSVNPYKPAQALATEGPFRYSRNPIYVAMTVAYIGATLLMNTIWPMILLPAVLVVMHWGVICREEKHLEGRFGETYFNYKNKVGRWLG